MDFPALKHEGKATKRATLFPELLFAILFSLKPLI
jgi:hypothetical protein